MEGWVEDLNANGQFAGSYINNNESADFEQVNSTYSVSDFMLCEMTSHVHVVVWQVEDLERKCRLQQEQIFNQKESLAHQQAEVKLKQTQFEGRNFLFLNIPNAC